MSKACGFQTWNKTSEQSKESKEEPPKMVPELKFLSYTEKIRKPGLRTLEEQSFNTFENRYNRHMNNLEKIMTIEPGLPNEPGQSLIF